MSERRTYRVGDLINVKHGFAFKGEFFSAEPTTDILLTPGNFKMGGGFKTDKFKYYNGEVPEDYVLNEGDILITMTDLSKAGDTLGYSAKIPPHGGVRYLHNQRLGLVQFKSDDVDENYLYWILRTQEYQHYIVSSATGSTVKHTSPTRICDYEFDAPLEKDIQSQIASILSSLEDKIELNLQMNQTLEALAQAIFKEWFVNFNFPGFEGESVDGLPRGWRKGSVLEIASLLSGGTPKTSESDFWDGEINWISAKDITSSNNQFIIGTEKTITELGVKKSAAKLLPPFTTIISARGTVGNFCLLPREMAISQSNYGLKSNLDYDIFLFLLVKNMLSMMKAYAYGAVFDTITTKTFEAMEITIPENQVIEEFENFIKPIYSKILINQLQIQSLTQTRDTILPKLMSGKIKFSI
ncbi:MAG: restriction endonuclease subunit S [Flavobacteriales bacterium]|jgi:type I restriction enzyme S subunit